jgi:REP element-mobilizing transposase RayT
MANTYTQLYIQFVFGVKYRAHLIHPDWEVELHKYMTGIVQNHGHKLIAINGMPDHIHVFVGLHTTQSIAELMRITKGESSEWVNENKLVEGGFRWQGGYGAFSYSKSSLKNVYNYIMNQKEHHARVSFLKEYRAMLEEFEIDYDEQYIFKEPM